MPESSGRPRIPVSYDDATPLPPWERRVARVPYMTSKTDPLTVAEKEALSSYWAADDTQTAEQHRPRTHSKGPLSASRSVKQVRCENDENRWVGSASKIPPPFLSPPPPPPPPKDSHPAIPLAPKTAQQLPTWCQAPPSPPESFKTSSSSAGTVFSIEDSQPHTRTQSDGAVPSRCSATTSAQDRSQARSGIPSLAKRDPGLRNHAYQPAVAESLSRDAGPPDQDPAERLKFGKWFKSALKDMFKRDPVDESKFERISDRHWTDE